MGLRSDDRRERVMTRFTWRTAALAPLAVLSSLSSANGRAAALQSSQATHAAEASLKNGPDNPGNERVCAASGKATTPSQPREISPYVGRYIADDGGEVVVTLVEGTLKLASGPMTFTLIPCGDGRFGTRERELLIAFTVGAVTVSEQGKIVARARRGVPSRTTIAPQGAALPQWLDANVPGLLSRYRVPAAAVAFISEGRVLFTRVYGERRRGEPASSNTLFNIASLSKPITAEVLLRLASAKRIDLDVPMKPYWVDPDLKDDRRADLLTVRMALQHRTGLPNWRSHTGNQLSFVVNPATTFRYSGEGYTYAARYAERRTGQAFEQLAKRLVFTPTGMRDTSYTVQPSYKTRAAYPHDAQGRELPPLIRLDFSGACCVHTTIGDYARFVATTMRGSALTPALAMERFEISREQRDEMCGGDGIATAECPSRIGMGLGWMLFGYPGETVVTHTGVNEGERSAAFIVPERMLALVVLTNGANGAKLIRDVTAAAYDNPRYLRLVEATAR